VPKTDVEPMDIDKWDVGFTKWLVALTRPIYKLYFRSEVRGLEHLPPQGSALIVANHSGGLLTVDAQVFLVDYYPKFGYGRPVYVLGHDDLFHGPVIDLLGRSGIIRATQKNAAQALGAGALVLVFPGGDYDVYRPTMARNVIDFDGRTGYVEAAISAGVPIVPAVTIGGQESQFYLTRGRRLAGALGLTGWEHRLFRSTLLPVTVGFPFGLSVLLPVNMPLPAKMVTELLPAIDIAAEFGPDPDVDEVDEHVRRVMQRGLDALAAKRRFPIIG